GRAYALQLAAGIFTVFILLTFLPFLMGWLGFVYLLLIVLTDLCLSYFTCRLLFSDTPEEGRAQIRRLYLTWGLFVAVFILTNLI
ncbi:MAG: prenyltransferase, partial [Methanothrix sp.]|nr:prenyltransferase [Methanothrix sp.]